MTPLESTNQQFAYHEKFDDEISLLDVIRFIRTNLHLLLLSFFVCFAPFVAYAYFGTKVYRAETFISYPDPPDIAELNVYSLSGYSSSHTTDSVFDAYLWNLNSRDVQSDFIVDSGLYERYSQVNNWGNRHDKAIKWFQERLDVAAVEFEERSQVIGFRVSIDLREKDILDVTLNEFVDYVARRTLKQLMDGVRSEVVSRKDKLLREIENKSEYVEIRRQDSLAELKEALSIAKRLDLRTGYEVLLGGGEVSLNGVSMSMADIPLYMRGEKALQAEIDVLESRTSNDAFASDIRALQEQLAAISKIDIDDSKIRVVKVDQRANPVGRLISPNTMVVLVLGLLLSAFTALIFSWIYTLVKESGKS